MPTFPRLKSDAVMQYPATRRQRFASQVVRFVDGSEQRYRDLGAPLKIWEIRLDLLDEAELTALEDFFLANQGAFGSFAFTDPWDGTEHADCSLDQDAFALALSGEMRGATGLVVRENRS
jgi:phage-related protein